MYYCEKIRLRFRNFLEKNGAIRMQKDFYVPLQTDY